MLYALFLYYGVGDYICMWLWLWLFLISRPKKWAISATPLRIWSHHAWLFEPHFTPVNRHVTRKYSKWNYPVFGDGTEQELFFSASGAFWHKEGTPLSGPCLTMAPVLQDAQATRHAAIILVRSPSSHFEFLLCCVFYFLFVCSCYF